METDAQRRLEACEQGVAAIQAELQRLRGETTTADVGTLPFVSCVCVTGKTQWHVDHLLPQAIECFQRQTYPADRRELVVVSDNISAPLPPEGTGLRTVLAPHGSLGALRNLGLEKARGDLIMQWDDDDWHHPKRIEEQVEAYLNQPDRPCFLKRQLCYSWDTDVLYVREFPDRQFPCIAGTILHPKTDFRYPDLGRDEDTEFAKQWPIQHWNVMDVSPLLYLRFSHDDSTSGHEHVMREAAHWPRGTWAVDERALPGIRKVIESYRPHFCASQSASQSAVNGAPATVPFVQPAALTPSPAAT